MERVPGSEPSRVRPLHEKVLDAVIRRGTVTARSDGSLHELFPVAIHPREGEALSRWVAHEQAISSIETGFGYGISTLYLFKGLLSHPGDNVRHAALDPNQTSGFSSIGLQLIDEAGLTNRLDFFPEASEIALPRLLSENRQFDFAFVDGNHRFDWVFLDLIYLGRLLRGGSVIFLDDYQLPAIRKALSFCTRNLQWTIEDDGVADDTHHWVVVRTAQRARPRNFDYFLDF
jgi:predicted O-methyltransferase YrrM